MPETKSLINAMREAVQAAQASPLLPAHAKAFARHSLQIAELQQQLIEQLQERVHMLMERR